MPSASDARGPAAAFDALRSVAFYVAFYLGSIPYVLGAAAAMAIDDRLFRNIVRGWSAFHRGCARVLLGMRVRMEGELSATPVLYALRHESFFEAIDLPYLLKTPAVVAKAELM